jgi:hypothetical protein
MASDGVVNLFLKLGLSDSRMVEQMFLSAYSRYPRDDERAQILEQLAQARSAKGTPEAMKEARRQSVEDMAWAILTSKEFLFNY